jgi:divalent metal cation (Fe/Co/Zn/Cd) transporter
VRCESSILLASWRIQPGGPSLCTPRVHRDLERPRSRDRGHGRRPGRKHRAGGFGIDSGIEVLAASALLWRFRRAGVAATVDEHGEAERRALYIVAATFFFLAAYIGFEATRALGSGEEPDTSSVGVILSIASLVVMPTLAYAKQRTGRALGSRALEADAIETWVCAYLSLALLVGVGLHAALGWWWADPAGALAMLPVIVWQGWEALEEARDADD